MEYLITGYSAALVMSLLAGFQLKIDQTNLLSCLVDFVDAQHEAGSRKADKQNKKVGTGHGF